MNRMKRKRINRYKANMRVIILVVPLEIGRFKQVKCEGLQEKKLRKLKLHQDCHVVFPLRKLYTEQMFVFMHMQVRNRSGTQPVKCFKR